MIRCEDCNRSFVDDAALFQHRKFKHRATDPKPTPALRSWERLDLEENLADVAAGLDQRAP